MKVDLPNLSLSPPLIRALFAVLSAALILVFSVYIFSSKEISLQVDGRTENVVTKAGTVEQLLAEADVDVSSKDEIEPDLDSPVVPGTEVTVKHAVPVVFEINGKSRHIMTTADTVGESIQNDLGVNLGADIMIKPGLKTRVAKGRKIQLYFLNHWIEKKRAEIPFETKRKDNAKLAKGQTRVVNKGRPGVKETAVEHIMAGGREIETIVRRKRTISEPVTQVVSIGTMVPRKRYAGNINVSRGGRSLSMVATAYASGTGGAGWRTATGTGVYKGIVAVDPSVIPLGTRLYIDGYGPAVAADTGGAIVGNRIDLGFGSVGEAIQFGRRTVVVHIQ